MQKLLHMGVLLLTLVLSIRFLLIFLGFLNRINREQSNSWLMAVSMKISSQMMTLLVAIAH